jgi:nucleoside phosphorylase
VRVLVTFALETEFAPWRALREFRPGKWGGVDAFLAEIGSSELGVVLTGVGLKHARLKASRAVGYGSEALGFCISSGVAGALRPQYQVGQVLAARDVICEVPPEHSTGRLLHSSAPLLAFAEEYGATAVDAFFSSERVIARLDEKRHLASQADAVEMESFEILHEAAACGIPAAAIRGVSDIADEELPIDMSEIFSEEGQISMARVMAQVARHPEALPGLLKLRQQTERAAESLAQFLDRYVTSVVERISTLESKATATAP